MPCPGDVGTLGICSRELLHRRSQPEEGWGRERQASPSSTADHLQRVRSPCLSFLTCPVEIMLLQEARRRKAFGDRLPRGFIAGSWSRGTPGSLIIHLVLRQVLETAPVTHCAEKGRRVPDLPRGQLGVFLATGRGVRCHLRVSSSSGPCSPGSPPGDFSPRCSSAFFQPWQMFGCCSSPIPRSGLGKYNCPFPCGSRLPWPVLSA